MNKKLQLMSKMLYFVFNKNGWVWESERRNCEEKYLEFIQIYLSFKWSFKFIKKRERVKTSLFTNKWDNKKIFQAVFAKRECENVQIPGTCLKTREIVEHESKRLVLIIGALWTVQNIRYRRFKKIITEGSIMTLDQCSFEF